MKKRSFDEMIAYFNRRVADMNISQECKMELVGMITAIGYEHETSVQHEAIRHLYTYSSTNGSGQTTEEQHEEAKRIAIEALQQTERKTGKWIIEPYDAQNDIFIHRCGTCMRVAMLGGHATKFKYCPICGSAMEGGSNGV